MVCPVRVGISGKPYLAFWGIGDIDWGAVRYLLDEEGIDEEEARGVRAQVMGCSQLVLEGLRDVLRPELRVEGRVQSLSYSGSRRSANPPTTSGEFTLSGV